jgi:hypothetical protein
MMPTTYTVPDNPPDVEAAALELIVRLPGQIMYTEALTEVLQDYCGALLPGAHRSARVLLRARAPLCGRQPTPLHRGAN